MHAASALRRPVLRFWLRGKLVLLVAGLVLVSKVLISLIAYGKARGRENLLALQRFDAVAASGARSLERILEQMVNDARILDDLAPLRHLVAPAGAEFASTDRPWIMADLWRSRLSEAFVNVTGKRPHYPRLGLIGRSEARREIARVNQSDCCARIVSGPSPLSAACVPYGADLREDIGAHAVFARIADDLEPGFVTAGASLRHVQPVTGASGRQLGAIVISVVYAAVLQTARLPRLSGTRMTVVNGAGDTMMSTPQDPGPCLARVDGAAAFLQGSPSADSSFESDGLWICDAPGRIVLTKIIRDPEDDRRFALYSVAETSAAALFPDAQGQLRHNFPTSLLIVVSSGLIARVASRRLMDPLVALHRRIRAERIAPDRSAHLDDDSDEIGGLARAFSALSEALLRQTRHAAAILETTPIATVTMDRHGRPADVNPAACALFGRPAEHMVGFTRYGKVGVVMQDSHDLLNIILVEDEDGDAKAIRRAVTKVGIANPVRRVTGGGEAFDRPAAGNVLKSNVGEDFHEAVGTLDQCWQVVELPRIALLEGS